MNQPSHSPDNARIVTRRDFIKASASAAATAALFSSGNFAFAAGSDKHKVGLIGCGGRGNGAIRDCLTAYGSDNISVIAFADLWQDRAKNAMNGLKGDAKFKDRIAATDETCFGGFDAYQKLIDSGVNQVLLATPPGFRPMHFEAAIKAGKNVFTEKPVCVDPWGYRVFSAAAEESVKKKLTVVAGSQRRHSKSYQATIEQIHNGTMGKLVGGQFYWMGGPVTHDRPRGANMSDIEWQILNWYAYSWTCGDHIVEQHVHNLDVMCWAFGAHPESAVGLGGRQTRKEPGNIWDHFGVEFVMPGGVRCASYCTHWPGGAGRVSERLVGEKGTSNGQNEIKGEKSWNYSGEDPNAYVQEHADCLASINGKGKYWNQAQEIADSTMTAVLGRMVAYTGHEIKWDWAVKASKLKLGPDKLEFGPFDPGPVPVPGVTPLV